MSAALLPVILMLEHDQDDRFLTDVVFKEHKYHAHLEYVGNSKQLFAYLEQCRLTNQPYPGVVLVNLNAVPQDGKEVLKQLKASADYRHIPVVILSDSNNANIARECYALGASSFIQKPDALNDTNVKISNFFRYWFETVVLS